MNYYFFMMIENFNLVRLVCNKKNPRNVFFFVAAISCSHHSNFILLQITSM